MVLQTMGGRWNTYGIKLSYLALLIIVLEIRGCCSLNSEGLALLRFRVKVDADPYGILENWNRDHCDPCMWSGVQCKHGKVQMLDLRGYSLKAKLAPELGNLTHLKSLVLSENHLFGAIPKEFGRFRMLEVLDLRDNNLSGRVPAVIGDLQSLRSLLICDNNFEGKIPLEIGKLRQLSELQFDDYLTSGVAAGTGSINRKFGHCIWHGSLRPFKTIGSFIRPIKGLLIWYFSFFTLFPHFLDAHADFCSDLPSSPMPHIIHAVENQANIERRKLVEQPSNLAAAPANGGKPLGLVIPVPSSRSSGSFRAVPNTEGTPPPPLTIPSRTTPQHHQPPNPGGHSNDAAKRPTPSQSPPGAKSGSSWKYIGIGTGAFLAAIFVCLIFICKSKAARTIGPWKTGLSGQLQKAFITGVPKLNRPELVTACEDFSNIVWNQDTFTVYKGTLSSGVEIGVLSTAINSLKDWSKRSELAFRKKIDSLSRINHKNFINLIGYCEEDEPFTRMMVFEYVTNGTLFEHLHDEELEPLDWPARMRAIMGTAYCLEYMHNLNPPLSHSDVNSHSIFFTDDYAAKIAELAFWSEIMVKSKSASGDLENSELPPLADPETNVYSFGILLLEVISGKSPYSERESLLSWAQQCLNDRQNLSSLVDPKLKSFKNNELMIICEVIRGCLQEDPRKRPTIKEVITKLREAIDIPPDAAVPRLSPLWWAELEILSSEAA
ncbi:protein MALE DISCOVERER 2-like [Lycium ferocissimum]|uniref:protein MALE DISCOVERER 2-like n=1 Tax=Lycium ferocissimum TaxID=112874 RepID=UPI00281653E8|nr:protein MALE DISCOVERER 2-like [Lycium ferocissimum]XP_059290511.1 protein MALE DISCOVERER 2-like [Lycium ferocissimum]